ELMSVVRRAVIIGDGPLIEPAMLIGFDDRLDSPPPPPPPLRPGSIEERVALEQALEQAQENITLTAEALNVSRVTLYRMLRRHRIILKRGLAPARLSAAATAWRDREDPVRI
ncbi:MAG: helix-turn-helix domain-containing protein, partial [Rhodopila sp.]